MPISWREHPRARGENLGARRTSTSAGGTSPRTRGKLHHLGEALTQTRNIPAHAGKTFLSESPHEVAEGTSPRTRGKQHLLGNRFVQPRNIPAHAGKTVAFTPNSRSLAEHPRARGENRLSCGGNMLLAGTSPRTRGKPDRRSTSAFPFRNIPAHAGKTLYVFAGAGPWEEHPRARGENSETTL